jgi:hypothetical protein
MSTEDIETEFDNRLRAATHMPSDDLLNVMLRNSPSARAFWDAYRRNHGCDLKQWSDMQLADFLVRLAFVLYAETERSKSLQIRREAVRASSLVLISAN